MWLATADRTAIDLKETVGVASGSRELTTSTSP
jgi:hypothetical protein